MYDNDLFNWLRTNLSEDSLRFIAAADYGADADAHLAALRDICRTGWIPRQLDWVPHEVLELTRWSLGDSRDHHMARAFACTLLCASAGGMGQLVTNAPILIASCLALGAEASVRGERFFAWLAEAPRSHPEDVDPLIAQLSRAFLAVEEERSTHCRRILQDSEDWALLRTEMQESMRADLWLELLETRLGASGSDEGAQVVEAVRWSGDPG